MPESFTLRDLARHFGQPTFRVDYAIRQHGPEPVLRAGTTRVWAKGQLKLVEQSLRRTAVRSTVEERRIAEVGR